MPVESMKVASLRSTTSRPPRGTSSASRRLCASVAVRTSSSPSRASTRVAGDPSPIDHNAERARTPARQTRRSMRRRQPPPSRCAGAGAAGVAATAATSIGASGSVASTSSAPPGGTAPARCGPSPRAAGRRARGRRGRSASTIRSQPMIAVILASGAPDRLYTGLSLLVVTAAEGEPATGSRRSGRSGRCCARSCPRRPPEVVEAAAVRRTLAELRATAAELPSAGCGRAPARWRRRAPTLRPSPPGSPACGRPPGSARDPARGWWSWRRALLALHLLLAAALAGCGSPPADLFSVDPQRRGPTRTCA